MRIEAMLWIVVLVLVALAFLYPKTRAFSLSAIAVAIVAVESDLAPCFPVGTPANPFYVLGMWT